MNPQDFYKGNPQMKVLERRDTERATDDRIKTVFSFTARKTTDTPTDRLMYVNKAYVNLNGTVANRPNSSVATVGQSYFATDTNIPMTYKGSNQWVNGVGSVVA